MTSVSSTSSSSTTSYTNQLSSIDWSALVDDAVNAKLSATDSIETKITANEAKISAYESLQSLLSDLSGRRLCAERTVRLLECQQGCVCGTDRLSVDDRLYRRQQHRQRLRRSRYDDRHLQPHGEPARHRRKGDERRHLLEEHGAGLCRCVQPADRPTAIAVDITIDADMSLADIASAINDSSDESGIKATVLQVSSSQYKLVVDRDRHRPGDHRCIRLR